MKVVVLLKELRRLISPEVKFVNGLAFQCAQVSIGEDSLCWIDLSLNEDGHLDVTGFQVVNDVSWLCTLEDIAVAHGLSVRKISRAASECDGAW